MTPSFSCATATTSSSRSITGRLKRFLPPQIAEIVLSDGADGLLHSHRREVVVLFCDLRGFTAFAETGEPEEVRRS